MVVLVLCTFAVSSDGSAQEQFDTDYAAKVLFMAVDKNDLPGVRAAIEGGANIEAVNPLGMQAVDIAVDRGYYDIAHYLISVRTLLAEKAKNNPPVAQAITPTPAPAEEWAARVTAPNETIVVETATETPVETDVGVTPMPKPEAPKPELPVVEKVAPQTLVAEAPMPKEPAPPPAPLSRPAITPAIAPATESPTAVADVAAPKIEPEIITETITEVAETVEPKAVEAVKEEVIELAEAPTTEPAPAPVEPIKPIKPIVENKEAIKTATEIPQTTVTAELPPEPAIKLPEPTVEMKTKVVQAAKPAPEPEPEPEPELVAEPSVPEPSVPEPAKLADSVAAPTAAEPLVEPLAPTAEVVETQSATMKFFSTFLDFFKPPNTTGVVRIVKRDPEQKNVNVSQQSSRSAIAPRDGGVKANVLAQQLKDLKQQQKEFLINNPPQEPPAQETNKEIELVFEENVEPKQDTIPDPFADPTNVDKLEAKLPPHPAEEDKIATDLLDGIPDDGGDKTIAPDELAGLEGILDGGDTPQPADDLSGLEGILDSTDESQTAKLDGTPTDGDWALKELDSASLPDMAIPSASDIVASGEILEDIQLALGEDVHVGQEFTENRLRLMKIETIHRPCVDKHGDGTLFCIDTIFWPLDMEENFRVDTIMYQGTRAIARYDNGVATNFHAMFNSDAFDIVANYYTNRYGAPTKSIARAIAPFAKPRKENPTMIWQSREPDTDLIVNLEIRKFDDARGGFPDTERGVVMLYKNHAEPIFPKLSQLELMVLEPDDKATANLTPSEPATPDSVW